MRNDPHRMTRSLILLCALALSACTPVAPPCPVDDAGPAAPSAGCLAIHDGGLLVVRQSDGLASIPGGASEDGETAQCTAHRETWEETGLDLQPTELVRVFPNGFHLYRCEVHAASGRIDPPARGEIDSALFLPPQRFDEMNWRFPEQARWLRGLLSDAVAAPDGAAAPQESN